MQKNKLLPCPFCGGEAKLIENNHYTDIHSVICKNCYIESDRYCTQEKAIRAWNTRKPMECIMEQLEECMSDAKNLWDNNDYYTGQANAFKDAIEIVKDGVDNEK